MSGDLAAVLMGALAALLFLGYGRYKRKRRSAEREELRKELQEGE